MIIAKYRMKKFGVTFCYFLSKDVDCSSALSNFCLLKFKNEVKKIYQAITAIPFACVVIADESHFLKNAQAKRTSASLPILQKAQYAILLSGTPALSRPIELYKQNYTDSAEAKIPAVLDYLGTVVEAGCKFIIFAHHHPMIDSIHQFLLKKKVGCIRIDGGTPAASRRTLVTEFQEKDSIRGSSCILILEVQLPPLKILPFIFSELSWTPGEIIQAEDRAHRIGQVSSVNIYYLLAKDTVDDIIWDVVQSKLDNLGQMLDGHEKSLEVTCQSRNRKHWTPS